MVVWACVSVAQLRRASVFVGGRKSGKDMGYGVREACCMRVTYGCTMWSVLAGQMCAANRVNTGRCEGPECGQATVMRLYSSFRGGQTW